METRRRYLESLAGLLCRWPRVVLWVGFVAALGAGLYTALQLEFKTTRNDLIGRDSEYWRHYSAYTREFRAEEDCILLVEGAAPATNRAAVDALVAAMLAPANNPHPADARGAQQFRAADLFYRVDLEALQPWMLYFLSEPDLVQVRDALQQFRQLVDLLQQRPKLDTFYDAMRQLLQTMAEAPAAERRQIEQFLPTLTVLVNQLGAAPPAAASDALLTPWSALFFGDEMQGEAQRELQWQGYQVFNRGQAYVVMVHPRGAAEGEPGPHDATIPKLRRIIDQVRPQFPQVSITLTGEPVLDHDEMVASQRDATRATVLTLVLIAVIFVVGFREMLRPLLGVWCMVLVVALSMGWATLAVGHLNIITVTFAVMLLGLGIDLSIQMIARFEEELSRGLERTAALQAALIATGPGILTAGLTNAAAFFAMMLSGFRGVAELGLIAGGGLVLATVVTMLYLPCLLLVVHRRQESRHIPAQALAHRLDRVLLSRPGWVSAGCAALTAVALSAVWRIGFDYNVLNLQSKGLPSVEAELRLLRSPDAESSIYASVVADNLDQARRLHQRLAALPTVAKVHSAVELIPENQDRKAPLVAAVKQQVPAARFIVPPPAPEDPAALLRSLGALRVRVAALQRQLGADRASPASPQLSALAAAIGAARQRLSALPEADQRRVVAAAEQRFYRELEGPLQMLASQETTRPLAVGLLPESLRQVLMGRSGKLLIRVFPKENIWDREPLERFVQEVQQVAPQATGTPLGLYEFIDVLQRGYVQAALWALLVITIIIAGDFRNLGTVVLTLVPLLVGVAWTLGALVLLGIRFNPANIMVLPLTVGIGVAYGIYIVQRFREDRSANFAGKSTGRAVFLSALTTIVGFAALMTGNHRGIISLGLVMSISISACLVSSLVLLPALLEIARRRGWRL